MIELYGNESRSFINRNWQNGDVVSIFIKDNATDKTYLLDYVIISPDFNKEQAVEWLSEIYRIRKEDQTSICYSTIWKTEELSDIEYLKSKGIAESLKIVDQEKQNEDIEPEKTRS